MAVFEGNFTQDPSSLKFALVISRFNDLVTDKLLSGCQDCLKRHGIDVDPYGNQVDYLWVPGSFEVPMVARKLAFSGRYDAVICLGAIIRGQTPHFDHVANEAAKGIANAAFETGVPVIFGILTTETMQQALERAGIKSNHGWGYAMNALEMANLMRQLNGGVGGDPADKNSGSVNPPALGEARGSLSAGGNAQMESPHSAQESF